LNTFLPYSDFRKSLECLDNKRLGKQRVEAYQLLKSLLYPDYAWAKHPASKLWRGYENALTEYMNTAIQVWIERSKNNTMLQYPIFGSVVYPHWFGNKAFHDAHKSNLLRKDFDFYSKFNWGVTDNLPYIWR